MGIRDFLEGSLVMLSYSQEKRYATQKYIDRKTIFSGNSRQFKVMEPILWYDVEGHSH